jgi:hypothetical protein
MRRATESVVDSDSRKDELNSKRFFQYHHIHGINIALKPLLTIKFISGEN